MNNDQTWVDPTWMSKTGGFAKDMTLRDYFAAKAMQGAMSGCATRDEVILCSELALFSYETADAMLKAREK